MSMDIAVKLYTLLISYFPLNSQYQRKALALVLNKKFTQGLCQNQDWEIWLGWLGPEDQIVL